MPPRNDIEMFPLECSSTMPNSNTQYRETVKISSRGALVGILAAATIASGVSKKSVAFNTVVRARKTIHVANYTQEEFLACWYTSHEVRELKVKTRQCAKVWERRQKERLCGYHSKTDAQSECSLGLFTFASIGSKIRHESRDRCVRAVIEEQRLQYVEGSDDPEYIAAICAIESHTSALSALERAR